MKKLVLACSFEITNFESPSRNPLQKPKSGDFDTENANRKPASRL
jgi:hypothetical protein